MAENTNTKSISHLGFFVALLIVVAIGGGVYLWANDKIFSPAEEQAQTAAANPGMPKTPKTKAEAEKHKQDKAKATAP